MPIKTDENVKEKLSAKEFLRQKVIFSPMGTIYLAFFKWLFISIIVGVFVGVICGYFSKILGYVTDLRHNNSSFVYFLPISGIVIVWLYKITNNADNTGTNSVILAARAKHRVRFVIAPLIFVSTLITHLFGGSAGREGAALQLGAALTSPVGKIFKLDKDDLSILTMCGMSAGFAALFGTPVGAAVFAVEVTIVAAAQYSALVPCILSGVISTMITRFIGNESEIFLVDNVSKLNFDLETISTLGIVIFIAILCAIVSEIFCYAMKKTHKFMEERIPNAYIRVLVGGAIVLVATILIGNRDYNGSGMEVIERAFSGEVFPFAFAIKIILTAVTLGSGFKGGEIVPSFFIGATFGAFMGGLMGLSPALSAGIGMISVFCGVTNCPFASIILSAELFGLDGITYFAVAILISYMLSGYSGLYSAQKFYQSKTKRIRFIKG